MQIKRFRGADMNDALQQVKKSMGNDAIILSTRHVRGGGGTFGLFGKPMLEVTAAQDTGENGGEASALLAALPRGLPKGRLAGSATQGETEFLRQMMAKNRQETENLLAPLQDEIYELKQILHSVGESHREQLHDSSALSSATRTGRRNRTDPPDSGTGSRSKFPRWSSRPR